MKKLLAILVSKAKAAIPFFAHFAGVVMLSKEDTFKKLEPQKLFYASAEDTLMPPAATWGLAPDEFKKAESVSSGAIGVFKIPGDKVKQFAYGGVKWGRYALNTDFGASEFIKTLIKTDKREVVQTENCIALWSHYWGSGYYDYLFFVFAKLLRIASVMDVETRASVKIAYPVFNTSFEKELIKLAGFDEDQLVDSHKFNVKANNYYLANTQSWYEPHSDDIKLIRSIMPESVAATGNSRIYISRAGRRKVNNETEIINLLKEFDFTIIEDKPRTVAEQMALFSNAEIIIGPHGAAFANILWSKPHTLLIELFPGNYFPPYFRYLAAKLDMRYAALFEKNIQETHYSNVDGDMQIEPELLREALTSWLG